jgi:transglutaminase 1
MRRSEQGTSGNNGSNIGNAAYRASLMSHYAEDLDRRRRAERAVEEGRTEMVPSECLKVDTVEMYSRDNAREHRTDRYELVRDNASSCVLRRGQPFFMALRMKERNFDARRDVLRVSFNFGSSPQVTKGTKVVLPFRLTQREFTRAPQKWDVRLHQQDGLIITLQVHIPHNALVGLWRCVIETTTSTPGSRVEEFRCKDDVYVLFNPFCRDDPVYLDNEDLRREYVFNETGKVFVGTHNRPKGRRWVYGQFSDVVLPAAQLLLEMSGLSATERGNPVQVVRAISSIVNATDDSGLLEGKFEGTFEDGVSPWVWTGSCKIFEQFLRNGCKPVKYGQCWVFAAVATSICRALGIPSRPVTNFVSAHDTNHTLSIDKYFDVFGEEIKGGPDGDSHDAVWNFHAWTEVFMARPDLPHGYGGWQAIDATPNKQSGADKMQCGPSSIEAVRRGEVGFAFDTPSLFAEVNADVCHFQEDESSHWGFKKIKVNNYCVGRQILTKRAGADDDVADADAEDITSLYKSPEGVARHPPSKQGDGCFNSLFSNHNLQHYGSFHAWPFMAGQQAGNGSMVAETSHTTSDFPQLPSQGVSSPYGERDIMQYPGTTPAERLSVINPRGVDRAQPIYEFPNKPSNTNDDVFFDLIELDKVAFGQPFNVTIHIQNRSTEMRTVTAILSASSIYYTGVSARRLGRADRQLVLQPGQRETLQVRVSWDEYRDKIVDYGMIKVYALASVQETKQTWSEEDDFQLEKPKLDVQIRGTPQVGQDCFVTFSFLNPLSVNLTECEFTFEGPGLVRPQTIKYRDVKMGEMVSHVQKFTPRQSGERKLVATFSSRELIDVLGSRPVHVRD